MQKWRERSVSHRLCESVTTTDNYERARVKSEGHEARVVKFFLVRFAS